MGKRLREKTRVRKDRGGKNLVCKRFRVERIEMEKTVVENTLWGKDLGGKGPWRKRPG